jgi:UDP:flavonoid glycosyltransferase YjiC (YdhE family)
MNKPLLIFSPEDHNLAEVTRMVRVAEKVKDKFAILFTAYDGSRRNHKIIENAGFEIKMLDPQLTEEQVLHWWRIERGEEFGKQINEEDLEKRIESELALYKELQPASVLTGYCLSVPISTRVAKVPLVWVAQSTWFEEYGYKYGTWPDALDYTVFRIFPGPFMDWLGRKLTPITFWVLNASYNKAAQKYGLPSFRGSQIVEGDYNLLAEPPEFASVPIPERMKGRFRFIGPLTARLDLPIPDEIQTMPRDLPIVYFAMGSSGGKDTVIAIIKAFAGQQFRVIAPVKNLIKGEAVTLPENVYVTDLLPAEKINPMADVAVIHGGIGTVMTACLSGTPIVGIPNGNPEQEWNLETIVRKGFGIHLHKNRFKPQDITNAINHFLRDTASKEKARAFQVKVKEWENSTAAAEFLEETFLHKTGSLL